MNKYLLTIGITSYNRVFELKRCLESIDSKYFEDVEIVISEDKSPRRKEIAEMVHEFQKNSNYNVNFNSNEKNLGYDRNLKKIIDLAQGKYVLFVSDDDKLISNQLDKTLEILKRGPKGVIYNPFYITNIKEYRRLYLKNNYFNAGKDYTKKHIYDSILFSGLIFEKKAVKNLDAERFLNKIYFQVYMFLYCAHFYGGYYSDDPLIECVSDGENGFGLSESSDNSLLATRENPLTSPEYAKCLISVIKIFDKDYQTNYFYYFEKEFNLRSVTYLGKSRDINKETLKKYWKKLQSLEIKLNYISKLYYYMFYFLGSNLTRKLLTIPKKILFIIRGEKQ